MERQQNINFPWGIYIGDLLSDKENIALVSDAKDGGLVLLYDDASKSLANNWLENIALALIDTLPLKMLELYLFDYGKKRFMYLSSLEKIGIYQVAYNQNRASILFDELEDKLTQRHHSLLSFETPTLSEYNQSTKSQEPYFLIVLNLEDFPEDTTSTKRIKNFLDMAYEAGGYVIAFANKEELSKPSKAQEVILKTLPHIKLQKKQISLDKKIFPYQELLGSYSFEPLEQNKTALTKKLLDSFEAQTKQDSEQDFLSIAIGKTGKEPYCFKMGLKSQLYSAFIAGATGTGKSNLINIILTQIAKNYSAKELELYLMDYNAGGLEFNKYKSHPNTKKLFLNMQDATVALEMLEEFVAIMQQRASLFNQAGVSSIDAYNKANPNHKVAYKILLIDEVQSMFSGSYSQTNSFNALLIDIAKKGRKYGLHFILSTQNLDSIDIDKAVISQIALKISFRLNSDMEAMKIFNTKEAYSQVPKLQKYHFLASTADKITIAKADYISESQIKELLQQLHNTKDRDDILNPKIYSTKETTKQKQTTIAKEQKPTTSTNPFDTQSDKELLKKLQAKKGEENA